MKLFGMFLWVVGILCAVAVVLWVTTVQNPDLTFIISLSLLAMIGLFYGAWLIKYVSKPKPDDKHIRSNQTDNRLEL